MKRIITLIGALAIAGASLNAQLTDQYPTATVVSGVITEDTTWTSDTVYKLDGYVFVAPPATLTIEAGTLIVGSDGQEADAAALIVARGAKIMASGTAEDPIIFTSMFDDISDPNDLTSEDKSLWGGVIVLGNAPLNSANSVDDGGTGDTEAPFEDKIEGLITNEETEAYTLFGSNDEPDPDHNAGVMRYISIRHGGISIGSGNEINGLTLGGVGSGTTVEFIEVFANLDDGIEFFGGTVNLKYAVVAFGADDSFDYDLGWDGLGQFWVSFSNDDSAGDPADPGYIDLASDNAGEWDGSKTPGDSGDPTGATVSNMTFIGIGGGVNSTGDTAAESTAIALADRAKATVINSIFANYDTFIFDDGDNEATIGGSPITDNVLFANNVWHTHTAKALGDLIVGDTPAHDTALETMIGDNDNAVSATLPIVSYSKSPDGNLDPRPNVIEAIYGTAEVPDNGFHEQTSYKGAFAPGDSLWIKGWTALDAMGYLPADLDGVGEGNIFNLSTRGFVEAGDGSGWLIGGIEIRNLTSTILFRGRGTSVDDDSLTKLADPELVVLDSSGNEIAFNDNWESDGTLDGVTYENSASLITGTEFEDDLEENDAAIVLTLAPGQYTVQVRPAGNTGEAGVAIVELFDVELD